MAHFKYISLIEGNYINERASIAIPVMYNNCTYYINVDSGSPISIINSSIFQKNIDSLFVDEIEILISNSKFTKFDDDTFLGLLGVDILKSFILYYNTTEQYFTLSKDKIDANQEFLKSFSSLDFTLYNNYPIINTEFRNIKLLLDTGTPSKGLILDYEWRERMVEFEFGKCVTIDLKGFENNPIHLTSVELLNKLTIHNLGFRDIDFMIYNEDNAYLSNSIKCNGILGLKLFPECYIDFINNILYYKNTY